MYFLSTRNKIFLAKIIHRTVRAGRAACGLSMQGVFTRTGGLKWGLDLNEGIDFSIWLLGAFERELIKFYNNKIHPGLIIIDIGANIGAHTLPLARKTGPSGKVIAIEATQFAYEKLMTNLALNPKIAASVIPIHTLLVESPGASGDEKIASSWPLIGYDSSKDPLCGAVKTVGAAQRLTLDEVVSKTAGQKIGLIKLDVDGHELSVLKGGANTLVQHRPDIIMELAPYCHAHQPGQFRELVDFLKNHGYVLKTIPKRALLPNDIAKIESMIPKTGSINIVCEWAGTPNTDC